MYKCVYVPATGCIFPAAYRNQVGPLPTHSASAGDEVGARGDQLLRGGATFPCGNLAFEALSYYQYRRSAIVQDRALVQDRSFPVMEGSQPSVPCRRSCVLGVGT